MRRDNATVHRRLNRASGLSIVTAVAEAAMSEQRAQFDERFGDRAWIEVREPEGLHAG